MLFEKSFSEMMCEEEKCIREWSQTYMLSKDELVIIRHKIRQHERYLSMVRGSSKLPGDDSTVKELRAVLGANTETHGLNLHLYKEETVASFRESLKAFSHTFAENTLACKLTFFQSSEAAMKKLLDDLREEISKKHSLHSALAFFAVCEEHFTRWYPVPRRLPPFITHFLF